MLSKKFFFYSLKKNEIMKTQEKQSVPALLKISVLCFVCLLLSSSSFSKKTEPTLLDGKIYIVCHFGRTLIISGNTALKTHLGHGDGLGRCGEAPPPIQD